MNDDFVIDENIIINAWSGMNAKKEKAHNERIFLNAFIPSDKKLLSTINIDSKYKRIGKMDLKDDKWEDAGIRKWFLDRLLDQEKCPIIEGIEIPKYKHVKDDDSEFVYLAIAKDGNLITADKRMHEEIQKEGLENKVKYYDVKDSISLVIVNQNTQ